ncbi:MAG: tyrosine-protein phosphatase [Bdellovibrionota bacterium]
MKTFTFPKIFLLGFFLSSALFAKVEVPRFLSVSPGVYRSGRSNEEGIKWLKEKYKIKTIINLENSNSAIKNEKRWAEKYDIDFHSLPMNGSKTPEDKTVNEALDLLDNSANHPILVHCKYGRDRTGLIIALHRVENLGWDAQDAHDEMIDLGFRLYLYKMNRYFKKRTGLSKMLLQAFEY